MTLPDEGRAELRARLAAFHVRLETGRDVFGHDAPITTDWLDALLAEINAAGYVLVERQHYTRLRSSHARRYVTTLAEMFGMPEDRRAFVLAGWYQDGDLDPLPEVGE